MHNMIKLPESQRRGTVTTDAVAAYWRAWYGVTTTTPATPTVRRWYLHMHPCKERAPKSRQEAFEPNGCMVWAHWQKLAFNLTRSTYHAMHI